MKSSDYIKRGRGMDMNSCSICHGPQNFGGQIRHTDECPVKALAEVEERVQRAERELAECRMERDRMQDRAVKYYVEIAALTPLAEEGAKAVIARRGALQMVADKAYRPDTSPLIYAEMDKARCEGELSGNQLACNPSEWYEMTDKGHERLAYLRGLVGEEKANDERTS